MRIAMNTHFLSCERSTMLLHQNSSPLLRRFRFRYVKFKPQRSLFRCLLPQIAVQSSANVIAAAAKAASVHGAVYSAINHVAVTAVAIASGACLSTKVDFLWPKPDEQPGTIMQDGVDVTGYPIFTDAKVQKAIAFARKAHLGQMRKSGDPYLAHCIHTGRILAALVPSSGKRAVETIVAGILHDVVDDTCQSLQDIEAEFGDDVAELVAGVSRLSYINQLLRRHRRVNVNQGVLGQEEASNLRVMLLGMIDDPRVVLIKLADRLHNMRTIYALPMHKAQAVAEETLIIWCSLASRLGLWALKAELEDLCFAVLQPQIFQSMRADLASMWSPSARIGSSGRLYVKGNLIPLAEKSSTSFYNKSLAFNEGLCSMKDLLEAVVPFDVLLDRRKRANFLYSIANNVETCTKPKVVQDAGLALASLVICEEALERELIISASYVPGMEVTLSSRLKSLYSIYSKMKRKDTSIDKVYDARALRVVVGDKNGTLHGPAVQCCYSLLDIVHRLWTPIDGEFDDYILNPKPSGYQSLHTAVEGPDNSPLEVQIRTQRMHEYAEHGLAAHWLYKETGNPFSSIDRMDTPETDASSSIDRMDAPETEASSSIDRMDTPETEASSYFSKDTEEENSSDILLSKNKSLKAGHPVLRVEGSHLLAAVIISVENEARELLVAVSFQLAASDAVADRRSFFQDKRWEAYARLYKKVSDEWWFEPGHGDWCTCLEKYTLCRDGMYHKQDQFGRLLPTFVQVINFTEQEESEYWDVVSAVFEGKQVDCIASQSKLDLVPSTSMDASINNKVHLLRTMLSWEEQLRRPKVSWGSSSVAGTVQVQCSDLSSSSGDRLIVGKSLLLRRVVPILGVPDALVPLDLPVGQINLFPGETTALWISVDVPSDQPPGQYEGEILITATKTDAESSVQSSSKVEKRQLYKELKECLDIVDPIDGKPLDEVVERVKSTTMSLRRILLSPSFSEFSSENGSADVMEEDAISNLSLRLKLNLTVWEFVLPETPSLPAVFGISDTVIEDRFGVKHGTAEWYEALDQHFKWLLQYRISPYFCKWADGMRVLTYTCPWPADHPKSDEYFSDPRLAAYAVPYKQVVSGNDAAKDYLQKQVEILRTKNHWRKAYFYLWDEPLNLEQYDSVRNMASDIHAYAPDARILTTYYCGPNDAPLAPTPFEAFVKVPSFLRPHNQIYCTSEWVLGNREDLVKDITAELQPENGEEWWTYVCMGPSDPHPNWHLGMRGTQHRAVMWRVWKEGGTGFLYWGANCYEKATVASAEIKFRHGLPPGDGVLYYPGEVFSTNQPVASLRLERLLSGLQDIEYLRLYASRYGRDEATALLDRMGVYFGPERYTHEHMPIDAMRGQIFNSCR